MCYVAQKAGVQSRSQQSAAAEAVHEETAAKQHKETQEPGSTWYTRQQHKETSSNHSGKENKGSLFNVLCNSLCAHN